MHRPKVKKLAEINVAQNWTALKHKPNCTHNITGCSEKRKDSGNNINQYFQKRLGVV